MNTKLTLRMDEALIASAKDYAAAHGSSVSQMVANYFAALEHLKPGKQPDMKTTNDDTEVLPAKPASGPITRSLIGILKPKVGQAEVSEDDYHAYLERKYLGRDGGHNSTSESAGQA